MRSSSFASTNRPQAETLVRRQRFGINILSQMGEVIFNYCARPGSDKRATRFNRRFR